MHGTINDVAMCGARPLALTAGFILEEGYPLADLRRIVASMAEAASAAGVSVVTGDTKVVERGKGDGVFINTTGIGVVPPGLELSGIEPVLVITYWSAAPSGIMVLPLCRCGKA